MGGYGPHPWPLSRWERGTAVLHRWTGCAGFLGGWVGNGIATWFDRLTMSGCAPRSICVECQAFLRVWRGGMVLSGLLYPGGLCPEGSAAGHRVQLQQQLAHYGHQGHFASFATLPQLTVEIRQAPRAAYRRQGRHVQEPAHHRATAPDGAPALLPATVPRPGGQSHQGGQRFPAVLPQFGQLGGQGGGGELPYARPINENRPGRCGPRRVSSLRPSGASWAWPGESENVMAAGIRGNHMNLGSPAATGLADRLGSVF